MCFKKKKPPQIPGYDFDIDIRPEGAREILAVVIKDIIKSKFPNMADEQIYLADSRATLPTYNDIAAFLAQDDTNHMTYKSSDLDCDDFAHRLKGQFSVPGWSHILLGTVWTSGHAQNWVITKDEELLFIEPQADRLEADIGTTNFRFFMT